MINERFYLKKDDDNVYMDTFIVDDPLGKDRKRPIIVICPGGGYHFCSAREAEPIALAFNAAGYHAAIVYYSMQKLFPTALKDLSDAVCMIRDNSEKWRVDKDKVIVCGFSAGGHLAASLGVYWNREPAIKRADGKNKPNGAILAYPVITSGEYKHAGSIENITNNDKELVDKVSLEKHITSDFPPAFLWHTFADEAVPVQNSLDLASAMAKQGISTELHIFPKGHHGLSLANEWVSSDEESIMPDVQTWINMAVQWVSRL